MNRIFLHGLNGRWARPLSRESRESWLSRDWRWNPVFDVKFLDETNYDLSTSEPMSWMVLAGGEAFA